MSDAASRVKEWESFLLKKVENRECLSEWEGRFLELMFLYWQVVDSRRELLEGEISRLRVEEEFREGCG